jgi:hypothetical protein
MYDLAAILLAFCTLRMLLRTWFSEIQALLGLLFVACTMPIALRDHYYQPWTLLEIGFFTIGLLLIMENRRYSLLFLILIASLNRETTVFIVLAFLLANLPLERPLRGDMVHAIKRVLPYLALYMVAWLGVFCGLRIMLGPATHVIDIPKLFRVNIQIGHLALTAWQAFWFLGAFWAFAFLGYAKAPLVIQRLVWVVPFYLTTFMVFGYWWEVRLLMPMYAIFLPLALSFLFPPQDSLRGIGVAHAGK